MVKASLLAALALTFGMGTAAVLAETQPQGPRPFTTPSRVFPVTQYGAVGDGTTKNTAAFQKALDAAGKAGGGVVIVPAGTFLTGSLTLSAHTTLRLASGAIIQGSDDPADYPVIEGRWEGILHHFVHRGLISAESADGVALAGEGVVQSGATVGNGREPRGPVLFEPVHCHGVRLEGLTLKNVGIWTVHPTFCSDVVVSHVNFDTHGKNSDGLDPDSCRRVRIEACTFSTGDDCISLKSGKGRDGAETAQPTEDVLITGCTFIQGHGGVAMGSEVSGGVRRVRIEHCAFRGGNNALLIKTAEGRGGFVEDITGEDLTVSGTNLFVVNTLYRSNPDSQPVLGPAGLTPIRNIRIHGVKVQAKKLIDVVGFAQHPIDGLSISEVMGTCDQAIAITNATHVALSRISVTGYTTPLITLDNVQGTGLSASSLSASNE